MNNEKPIHPYPNKVQDMDFLVRRLKLLIGLCITFILLVGCSEKTNDHINNLPIEQIISASQSSGCMGGCTDVLYYLDDNNYTIPEKNPCFELCRGLYE